MWILLFNLSSKFYKKDYKLNIIVNDLSVSMNFSDNLYDFLVYLMEEVYIDNISDLQEKYKISEKVLQFFHKIGLLICSSDLLGKEAMWFHSIIQNPSITNFPNQVDPNNLDVIYKNIPNYFYNSFYSALMELIERDSFLYSWLLKSKFVYKLLDDMLPSNILKTIKSCCSFII